MLEDPITEEIRKIRHALAAKFGNDIDRIAEDLRRRQRESGRKIVSLPSRPPRQQSVPVQNLPVHAPGNQMTSPAPG